MDTKNELDFYNNITDKRYSQSQDVYNALKDYFYFDKVECIETGASSNLEDGCFGLYLAKIAESTNGIYHSVDIYKDVMDRSVNIFNKYIPEFSVGYNTSDSIKFLEEYSGNPNLVHLDSFDLDLTNPIPSMLHCWLEFVAIKDKMPSGSIIMIDDNFFKNSWVSWNIMFNNEYTGESKIINIDYDIVGKGSLIYHWCKKENSDWYLISNDRVGENVKVIIKKK